MFRHNIPLGRILGIQIGLDYSWFVIFALLSWMLAGHRVSQAMTTHCATVPADLTLQQLVDGHILANGQRCFLVNRGRAHWRNSIRPVQGPPSTPFARRRCTLGNTRH
jgi:hypothetical protein